MKQKITIGRLTEPGDKDEELELEERLIASANHVTMARAQRLYRNEIVRRCKEKHKENLHFNYSDFALTFDYIQNLGVPYFREEQPGDMYYFSILTLNIFGIVDHREEQDYLFRFLYHEGERSKATNNIGSIVY